MTTKAFENHTGLQWKESEAVPFGSNASKLLNGTLVHSSQIMPHSDSTTSFSKNLPAVNTATATTTSRDSMTSTFVEELPVTNTTTAAATEENEMILLSATQPVVRRSCHAKQPVVRFGMDTAA